MKIAVILRSHSNNHPAIANCCCIFNCLVLRSSLYLAIALLRHSLTTVY
ncbi:hypothetical protein [Nostoc sp.]